MKKHSCLQLLAIILVLIPKFTYAQGATSADVAAYQFGVVAEARPGTEITYVITVTNQGPKKINTFYILDGWTVNSAGISGFAAPLSDPNFGKFKLTGKWGQNLPDQRVVAWLLEGDLSPGDTAQFNWKIQVNGAYRGELVNWASVQIDGELKGIWTALDKLPAPPKLSNAPDPEQTNNRTPDGVTLVTESPRGKGIDLAAFQAGLVSGLSVKQPLASTMMVTNRGPEAALRFYLMAGWSLDFDKSSLLTEPIPEPEFGNFRVVGRWTQARVDEEIWLWLLEGNLAAGNTASFPWKRSVKSTYRGDMVNWIRVLPDTAPDGQWTTRAGTTAAPGAILNPPDVLANNNRSTDTVTTISD